ncbi:MAG: zinc ribbon domain-containing protein [Erysipelotrichaceae bacterium]
MLCPKCQLEIRNDNKYLLFKHSEKVFCVHCGAYLQEVLIQKPVTIITKIIFTIFSIVFPIILIEKIEIYNPDGLERLIVVILSQALLVNLVNYLVDKLFSYYGYFKAEEVEI